VRRMLEVLELFAECQVSDAADFQAAFDREQRRALYAREYDAERAKRIKCDATLRAKRKASWSAYEKRRWKRIKADPILLAAHNAKRMAAHWRAKKRRAATPSDKEGK